MVDKTPLVATQDDEQGFVFPETPVFHYVLSRRTQRFSVMQYVDDIEVTHTINSFLNHCRDMGWKIEILGMHETP